MDSKITHHVDVHVGQMLRKRRQELGISQEELGEAVNLTFQQIQKYEKGYNRISCSKLYEFSSYLNIQISYFFIGLDDFSINADNSDYRFSDLNSGIVTLDSANEDYQFDSNDSIEREIDELLEYFKIITSKKVRQNIVELVRSLSNNIF